MARTTITLEQRIEAPVSQVYRAFTNETALREWLCDGARAHPAKGGRVHLWWANGYYATGEYRKLVADQAVEFTWLGRGEPRETRVSVTLQPDGEATVVSLAHQEVGTGRKWAEAAEAIRRGWEQGLENLRSVLETGHDLRLIRRPMLGIYPSAFTAEARERLGVPAKKGMLIGKAVEGMGAHAAGLEADDVITRIDQAKVGDWASLQAALSAHRAGDDVAVTYYRGPEKRTTVMTLSARSIEEPPATPAALAEAIGAADEECLRRLGEILAGAAEEAAGRRPDANEWSAKEVLCHLIVTHRSTQEWMVELVAGQEREADDWAGNLDIAHAGLLAVYPTVGDLMAELRRNAAETRAMVAALPESFVARKGSYWRLARSLVELSEHNEEHIHQVEAALTAG
jgi:uncharacterized protein YndB with AHSA1/START domain